MSLDGLRLRCPACGAALLDTAGGQRVLRNAIVKFDADGGVAVRCPAPGCRADIAVPWLQVVDPPPGPRRVLVRRG